LEANGVLVLPGRCLEADLKAPELACFLGELHGGAINVYYVTDCATIATDKMEAFLSELRGQVAPVQAPVTVEPVVVAPIAQPVKNDLLERTKPVQISETVTDALAEGALFKEGTMSTFSATAFAMTADDADSFKAREAIVTQEFDGVKTEVKNTGANPEQLISIVDPAAPKTRGRKK
jgi:hypothetical protein